MAIQCPPTRHVVKKEFVYGDLDIGISTSINDVHDQLGSAPNQNDDNHNETMVFLVKMWWYVRLGSLQWKHALK